MVAPRCIFPHISNPVPEVTMAKSLNQQAQTPWLGPASYAPRAFWVRSDCIGLVKED